MMLTAVFRPEAKLKLFLRMHTKEIAKSLRKYTPIEEILPHYKKSRSPGRMAGQMFDRKLLNSRFRARAVKMFLNFA